VVRNGVDSDRERIADPARKGRRPASSARRSPVAGVQAV